MHSPAVLAALDAAADLGVRCSEPVVLRDLTNVVVHLAPAPVIARVPITLGRLRGRVWEDEIVGLATFLADARAPVVAPSRELPPGPHERDGFVVSFWEHVDHDRARFDAAEAGRSLRVLHEALASYPRPLPRFERLDEIERVIEGLEHADAAILRDAQARLSASAPLDERRLRPVHGDVHFGNVLWSPEGPRWNDVENACLGPVEYDLAGIAWRGDEGTDTALTAYGKHDTEMLERVTPYLALFLAAWTLDLAGRHPRAQLAAEERLARVREWLLCDD